jgi:hypothetical protein
VEQLQWVTPSKPWSGVPFEAQEPEPVAYTWLVFNAGTEDECRVLYPFTDLDLLQQQVRALQKEGIDATCSEVADLKPAPSFADILKAGLPK